MAKKKSDRTNAKTISLDELDQVVGGVAFTGPDQNTLTFSNVETIIPFS